MHATSDLRSSMDMINLSTLNLHQIATHHDVLGLLAAFFSIHQKETFVTYPYSISKLSWRSGLSLVDTKIRDIYADE